MKTILLLSFLLISKITFAGVSCGTHDRVMYVDCMVDIINEQNNGNSGPWLKLINYAHHNCMSYVALFGLDQGVMGNATLENVLSDMVVVFHNAGIKVGAVGSASTFFNDNFRSMPHWTDPIDYSKYSEYFSTDETNVLKSITNVNPESSFSVKATAEIAKFQLHTFVDYNSTHAGKIDVLSLEYEYWNLPDNSTNPTTCDRAAEYQNHKNILTAMQIIKDNSTYPLLVEDYLADFSNTLLTASGPCQVTETTQVEELDWLSDRILLTTYNAYTANLFTRNCKRLQLLGSDTKSNTEIWPLFSAETNATITPSYPWVQNFCNAQPGNAWGGFLGGFLMGSPSNGLGKVDDAYFNDYAAAIGSSTACPGCGCTFSNGNNLDLKNIMWFTYTLLADPYATYHSGNWLSRKGRTEIPLEYIFNSIEVHPNPSRDYINLTYSIDDLQSKATFTIYSVDGKTIFETPLNPETSSLTIERNTISPGIYFCKLIVNNSLIDIKTLIIE
ncbi:MAG: T9SS type A sorting domain-containing protein [Bacteroidetes bacterium]|nr:T9SS type A sorting domain-containing protein [Bacteroidota bacterium]